jgi:3-(methylthio)propanoyl-CoA dehydrogenase
VRITTIYEGTTGIQSNDLIGRKFGRDGGATMRVLIEEMQQSLRGLQTEHAVAARVRDATLHAVDRCPPRRITPWRCRCRS